MGRRRKPRLNRRTAVAVLVAGLVLALYLHPLSYLPQSDISFAVAHVLVERDGGGFSWEAYPYAVSWSRQRDHANNMPGVSVATTLSGVEDDRVYNITFGDKKYAVYAYKVYIQVEVKAVGGDPTGPRIDSGVKVTLWIRLYSRGDWRLLWAKAANISEVSRWTAPRGMPNSNWNIEGGLADAAEPAATNALVAVGGSAEFRLDPGTGSVGGGGGSGGGSGGNSGGGSGGSTVSYYYSYGQFWDAGSVDGKFLRFSANLRAPEAWFWDLMSWNYYYTWGEAIVTWTVEVTVAIAKEIRPENPDLGDLRDEKPSVEGVNNVSSMPWWAWVLILAIAAFLVWNVARVVVAYRRAGGAGGVSHG